VGDHIWWVSDIRKFGEHFPSFKLQYDIRGILTDIHGQGKERWQAE
jgi:CDP-paratose 2-epimerase